MNDDGLFWEADNPETKFPGKVLFSGKHIHFTTSPVYASIATEHLPELFGRIGQMSPLSALPVLLGQLGGSPCTLIDLHPTNDGGFTDLSRMQSVSYKQYRVSLCVLGIHLAGPLEPSVNSARFSYSALKHWQKALFDVAFDDESTTIKFNRNTPPFVEGTSIDKQFVFSFDIKPELQIISGEIRTRNEAVFEIKPHLPKSLDWMLNIGYRIENFFCLVVGSSLRVQSIALKIRTEIGWCRRQIHGTTAEVRHQVTIRLTSAQLAHSIALWLDLPEDFRPLEKLLYAIRNEKVSERTRFLTIANGLEGLHRLTNPDPKQEFTFSQRIHDLLSRLSPDFGARLVGNLKQFVDNLATTRNNLTHPGIQIKPTVITDDGDLFMFTQKCNALLRFLVLQHVGMEESITAEPIYQQSRTWTIL